MQYLDGKTTVTHIIASSLTPKKVVEFRRYRIVKPAWVVDSIAAGKLLPWDRYRVVDEGIGQKVLQLDSGGISSQFNVKPQGYRDQTDTSWYTSQLRRHNSLGLVDVANPVNDIDEPSEDRTTHLLDKQQGLPEASAEEYDELAEQDLADLELPEVSKHYEKDVAAKDLAARDSPAIADHLSEDALEESADAGHNLRRKRDSISPPASPVADKRQKLTAEEHNALLLLDPRIRKSSTLNPDFLEQYYRESRLHHLSAWKADLKSQLQAMTAEKSASQKQAVKRSPGGHRYILHVDFDSFFVAVSLKACPHNKDKPVVVAHGGGSGSEIASCNYPARTFGVKNGMWMKKAQELCKELIVLPYDFSAYEAASKKFYAAILAIGGIVQSVSIDEALLDITSLCTSVGSGTTDARAIADKILQEQTRADEIAKGLRDTIRAATGCEVSVGIGGNILLAKVALRKAKPAGQHQVRPDEVMDFLAELEVENLPGVASSIGGKLEELGIRLVKDIRGLSKERLTNVLGPKTGEKMWNYARGIDRTEVGDQVVRKSVSAEVNWGVRFETNEQAEEFVESLCGELSRRLLKENVRGKQLTMKIMRRAVDAPLDPPKHLGHGKCDTFNKSVMLGVGTNSKDVLAKEALSILRGYGFSPGELRGLGVQMQKLEPSRPAGEKEWDGSQKRLQFKTGKAAEIPAILEETTDPIEEFETPKKPKSLPGDFGAVANALATSTSPSRKRLNVMGTQFILPTQFDPAVLAELPTDIRDRLAKNVRPVTRSVAAVVGDTERAISKATTKVPHVEFPTQSQLDPEILEALPLDVRAEVLAQYETSPSKSRSRAQSLLPQSPRKNRTLPPQRKATSARGRRGGGSLLSRFKAINRDTPTLTQSNFVARSRAASHDPFSDGNASDAGTNEISSDFLDALPSDLRREVLETHKREQLKRTAGIEVSRRRRGGKGQAAALASASAHRGRVVLLPPRAARPTFTTQKLSSLPELREAISAWHEEFRDDGPYSEDVEALGRYLGSVVKDEADMSKAAGVVKWLEWVVENGEGTPEWLRAIEEAKTFVNKAAQDRQLGAVALD